MTTYELKEKLKINVSPRVQQTLDAIYQICLEQQERGVNDFSIATIARLGHQRGVPKAQSIRNKSGEKYRTLISLFANSIPSKNQIKLPKVEDHWIDEIQNPKHKLLVRIMASELRQANQKLNEIISPNTRIDVYDHAGQPAPVQKLNNQERRALEYIVSDKFMDKWNLQTNEFGEMVNQSNQPVFKVATIDAIKKALEYL